MRWLPTYILAAFVQAVIWFVSLDNRPRKPTTRSSAFRPKPVERLDS